MMLGASVNILTVSLGVEIFLNFSYLWHCLSICLINLSVLGWNGRLYKGFIKQIVVYSPVIYNKTNIDRLVLGGGIILLETLFPFRLFLLLKIAGYFSRDTIVLIKRL
jgi:hypothetical protein